MMMVVAGVGVTAKKGEGSWGLGDVWKAQQDLMMDALNVARGMRTRLQG